MINPEIYIYGILAVYLLLILSFHLGLFRLENNSKMKKVDNHESIRFSVVIAARNESQNIVNLITDIENLNYNYADFEVIIIDDDSKDSTFNICQKILAGSKISFKILKSTGGKKKALQLGVNNAQFTYIAFTDADCRIPQNWLAEFAKQMASMDYLMISGPVFFQADSGFEKIVALEFASLVASGAAAIGIQKPIMVNGANLVVEKNAWLHVQKNQFQLNKSSGDDIFAMSNVKKIYGSHRIGFAYNINSVVVTSPPKSIKEFFNQRLRWTSKSTAYRDFYIIIVAILIFFVSVFQFYLFVIPDFWIAFLPMYFIYFTLLKLILDITFLSVFLGKFDRRTWLSMATITAFIYPFYIVLTAVLGNIVPFKWKDREIRGH